MAISYEGTFFSLVGLSSLLLVGQPTRKHMLRAQAGMIKKKDPDAKLPPHSKRHPQRNVYKVYSFMVVSAWLQVISLVRYVPLPSFH